MRLPTGPTMLLFSALIMASLSIDAMGRDTVLDDQFCQVYYKLSKGDCPALRSSIRSERRGNGTPTLELGDPETQPAMFFLHGWPDTSAVWANQFAAFCGKEYFCVAPSWIDFHPDVPRADPSKLFWSKQREDFYAIIEDLGLRDITFVLFGFGGLIGYQMLSLYPDRFSRVIAMGDAMKAEKGSAIPPFDGMIETLPKFEQSIINAFLNNDDNAMMLLINPLRGIGAPCIECTIAPAATGVGARTGWPFFQMIRTDRPWTEDGFDIPTRKWEFSLAPSFPESAPILYMWASEMFIEQSWANWIETRGDGSQHIKITHSDHWINVHQPEIVNARMAEFLRETRGTGTTDDESDSDTKDGKQPASAPMQVVAWFVPGLLALVGISFYCLKPISFCRSIALYSRNHIPSWRSTQARDDSENREGTPYTYMELPAMETPPPVLGSIDLQGMEWINQ